MPQATPALVVGVVCYNSKQYFTMNTYTLTNNEGTQQVQRERWGWGVLYQDGTELHQFDANTREFHQFKEIDWSRAKLFVVRNLDDHAKRIDIPVAEGMQYFYVYRNVKPFYADEFKRVYMFGWKNKQTGDQHYQFILPDDRIIVSTTDAVDLVEFNV